VACRQGARHSPKGPRSAQERLTNRSTPWLGEFKPLLDRDFVKVSVQPITDIATPPLRELVDASLRAFRRCEIEAAEHGKPNEDVAALVLFRQIIELADGVEVLVNR
jgi:hypothetical protein